MPAPFAIAPPVAPMLARLARELPEGDLVYEPKWDGFRGLAFVAGDGAVDLRSRHRRPFGRYFPELVAALRPLAGAVLDGEIVVGAPGGRLDFPALLARLHPSASRVARLARETPAALVAFDLLAADGEDLRARPFVERRARLERLLRGAGPSLLLTPATADPAEARRWLDHHAGGGIDGVVAKERGGRYEPGRRAMVKVKRERTAECVVGGFRTYAREPVVASLLLGLWDGDALVHVGVASSFPERARRALHDLLAPDALPLAGHPWERGFNVAHSPVGRLRGAAGRWDPGMPLDWTPVAPRRVVEIGFDRLDGDRLRHPARFLRWRPDREPSSCALAQLGPAAAGRAA